MKISFITDEFTQNLDEAITFALEQGIGEALLVHALDLVVHLQCHWNI